MAIRPVRHPPTIACTATTERAPCPSTHSVDPSADVSCFQIGTCCLSVLMSQRQAENAVAPYAQATPMTTLGFWRFSRGTPHRRTPGYARPSFWQLPVYCVYLRVWATAV